MRDDKKNAPNVLVIERDAATRSGIKRLLETNGYFVNAVASENEAEIATPQKNYDLILFDTYLPPPESFAAAYLVHQRPKLQHIPLLAISVHDYFGVPLDDPKVDNFSVFYLADLTHFDDLEKLTACLLKKNDFCPKNKL